MRPSESLRLAKSTSLNQGVMEAVDLTGKRGGRNVLVLSDGRDTTGTPLKDVLSAVKASGAKVDVVALQRGGSGLEALARIAKAGRGTVIQTVDPATLTTTFQDEARNLTRQVLVTADVPTGDKTDGNVEVSIESDGQTWTDTAYTTVREKNQARCAGRAGPGADLLVHPDHADAGRRRVGHRPRDPRDRALDVDAGQARDHLRRGPDRRVRRHRKAPGREEAKNVPTATSITGAATAKANQLLANNRSLEAKIAKRLEGAASSLRPAEWLLLHGAIAMATALVFLLLSGGNVILLLVGLLVGAFLPWFYLGFKQKRRIKAFQSALADTLQLMSGSLSAGLSLAQSIDTIVREGTEPIAGEFRRVVVESRLGVPLEDAMEGVAERMESRDFEWVVMAIRIQREVGGNLAELLLTVAATLREREYLRRHVRALSAEGRLSLLHPRRPAARRSWPTWPCRKPDYVKPMFTTPIGWVLLRGHGCAARRRHLLDVQGREGGGVMSAMVLLVGVRPASSSALFLVFAAVGGFTKRDAGRQPLARRARGAHRGARAR